VDAVDLSLIVKALLSVFAPRLRNKRVVVETDIKGAPEISAVPGEIRQLVANLLSNSIDAVGKGGRIRIRISSAESWDGDRTGGARLTIADNGPGIPPEIRPRLFEPFVTTKKDVGTGLGLWVCKSIVERYGGTIRLKSSIRDGESWTAFSVFLPAVAPIAGSEA
jgi:signal transduction histidine kinase